MLRGGGGGGGTDGGSNSELVAVVVEGLEIYLENYKWNQFSAGESRLWNNDTKLKRRNEAQTDETDYVASATQASTFSNSVQKQRTLKTMLLIRSSKLSTFWDKRRRETHFSCTTIP